MKAIVISRLLLRLTNYLWHICHIVWFCPHGVFLSDRVSVQKCKAKSIHNGKEGSCVQLLPGQESRKGVILRQRQRGIEGL